MDQVDAMPDRLLRRTEVQQRCGICRSTVYRLMQEGEFPAPLRIGPRAVRWRASEVDAWIRDRPRACPEADAGASPGGREAA